MTSSTASQMPSSHTQALVLPGRSSKVGINLIQSWRIKVQSFQDSRMEGFQVSSGSACNGEMGGPYLLKPDGGRRCTSGGFRRLHGNVGEKEEKYGFPGKQLRGDHIFWSQMGEDDAPQGSSEGYRATVAPGRPTKGRTVKTLLRLNGEKRKRNMASQESNNGGIISFWRPDGGKDDATSGGFRRLQGNVGEKEEKYDFPGKQQRGTISFEARWGKTMHLRGVQKATGQRWHQEGLQRTTIKTLLRLNGEKEKKYGFPGKQQRGDHIFWSQMGEDDAPQGSSEGYRATSERKKRKYGFPGKANNGGTISFEARWGKTMHLRGVQKATGQRRRERREIWLPRKATTGGPYLLKPDGGRRCTSGGFRRLQGNVGEKEEKYGFPGKQQGGTISFEARWGKTMHLRGVQKATGQRRRERREIWLPREATTGDNIFWSQMGEDDAPQGGSEGYRATSERNMTSQESNNGGTISFEARWGKTMHLRGVQKATGQRWHQEGLQRTTIKPY